MPTIKSIREDWGSVADDYTDNDIAASYAKTNDISLARAQYELKLPITSTNKGLMGDMWTNAKSGVAQLPGTAAAIVDLPVAAVTGYTPLSDAYNWATNSAAKKYSHDLQYEMSPEYQAQSGEVNKAWEPVDREKGMINTAMAIISHAPELAAAYAKNPQYTLGQVIQSLPGMIAGGLIGRGLAGAGRISVADGVMGPTVPGYLERAVGEKWAVPLAAGVGEGSVAGGQNFQQSYEENSPDFDARRAALAGLGAAVTTGAIGVGAGRLAHRYGLETAETAMAGGIRNGATDLTKIPEGARPGLGFFDAPGVNGRIRRLAGSSANEALLQEFPQSVLEAGWQNIGEGRDFWDAGVDKDGNPNPSPWRQGVEGAIAGGLMAAPFNMGGRKSAQSTWDDQMAAYRANLERRVLESGQPYSLLGLNNDAEIERQMQFGNYEPSGWQNRVAEVQGIGGEPVSYTGDATLKDFKRQHGEQRSVDALGVPLNVESTSGPIIFNNQSPAEPVTGILGNTQRTPAPTAKKQSAAEKLFDALADSVQAGNVTPEEATAHHNAILDAHAKLKAAPKDEKAAALKAYNQVLRNVGGFISSRLGVTNANQNGNQSGTTQTQKGTNQSVSVPTTGSQSSSNNGQQPAAAQESETERLSNEQLAVRKLMDQLTPDEQKVLHEYNFEKRTFDQIAEDNITQNEGSWGTRARAQQIHALAKAKLVKLGAQYGLTQQKIDEIFPNENNRLQGGADVQTYSAGEMAQMGSAMHVPGSKEKTVSNAGAEDEGALGSTDLDTDGVVVGEGDEVERVGANKLGFGEGSGEFDEDSHLRRAAGKEGVEDAHELTQTAVDHRGQEIKQADIDDASLDFDDGLKDTERHFKDLTPTNQMSWVKAWVANQDGVINARKLAEIFDGLLDTTEAPAVERKAEETRAAEKVQAAPTGEGQSGKPKRRTVKKSDPAAEVKKQWDARAAAEGLKKFDELDKSDQEALTEVAGKGAERVSAVADAISGKPGIKFSIGNSALKQELETWKAVVKQFFSGKLDETSSPIVLTSTPAALQAIGLPNRGVTISVKHGMGDALYEHGFKKPQMEDLPNQLVNPVAIYYTTGTDGKIGISIVTDTFTAGSRMVFTLHPEKTGMGASPVHFVATVVPRGDGAVMSAARNGNFLYAGSMPDNIKAAFNEGMKKFGQTAIDLKALLNPANKFDSTARTGKIAYKSDAAKLVEEGKAQYSTSSNASGTTTSAIQDVLQELTGKRDHSNVTIYNSLDEVPENVQKSKGFSKTAQAFVNGKKSYFIASNIEPGTERAVFLHEIGSHLGLEYILGDEQFSKLVEKIVQWGDRKDGSLEYRIANLAFARIEAAGVEDHSVSSELVAYFIEEAVNMGVNPTADNYKTELGRWFRTVWAAFKNAARKFFGDVKWESFSAQDLVNLAYGAAHLELNGTWHGTAADFRNFNHEYMGTGEGAQAYGWGTYLAQRVGIAKEYWKADTRRKGVDSGYPNAFFYDGKKLDRPINPDEADAEYVAKMITAVYGAGMVGNRSAKTIEDTYGVDTDVANRAANIAKTLDVSKSEMRQNRVEGSLMRTAVNAREDEMLDWDKPLSEQSEHVVNALLNAGLPVVRKGGSGPRGVQFTKGMTGAEFYRRVAGEHNPGDAEGFKGMSKGSDKAASEYLDSLGIKGIQFLDAKSRDIVGLQKTKETFERRVQENEERLQRNPNNSFVKDTLRTAKEILADTNKRIQAIGEPTRNLVVFNDKNIVRALTHVGAKADHVKFSKNDIIGKLSDATFAHWLANITGNPDHVRQLMHMRSIPSQTRAAMIREALKKPQRIGAQQTELKFSKAVEQRIQSVAGEGGYKAYTDANHYGKTIRSYFEFLPNLVDRVAKNLPAAKEWYRGMLAKQATRFEIERAADSVAAMASKLKKNYDRANEFLGDSTFDQKWAYQPEWKKDKVEIDPEYAKRWASLSKEEQQVIDEVFKNGEDHITRLRTIFDELGIQDKMTRFGQLQGPYAPLKRFGNFVGLLKSKELIEAEKNEDTKKVEELSKNPDHLVVRKFQTLGQARLFADQHADKYAFTDAFEGDKRLDDQNTSSYQQYQKILGAVKVSDVDPAARKEMEETVRQLYLNTIDETNARMSGQKRKNRAGYDADMIKSFLENSRANAIFVSNLEHGGDINDAYYRMKEQAKTESGHRPFQEDFNTLTEHYRDSFTYKPTPIQDALIAGTSLWQLSTSLGYHVANAMQGIMVTLPKLAAEFNNYGGAWSQMLNGYKVLREISGGMKADLTKIKNANLRAALEQAAKYGLIDVGIEEDLSHFSGLNTGYGAIDNPSKLLGSAAHKMRQVARMVEMWNRVAAGTAAYNMAVENGMNHEAATEYTIRMLQDTQFDFSRIAAPLVLKKIPKVTAQYKKYQLGMAALYVRAFLEVMTGMRFMHDGKLISFDPASAEVRAIARRMLAYKLFHTSMAAGVLGMPLMNLAALAFAATGGDDDKKDLEKSLREAIGDKTMADILLHGPLTSLGINIGAKLGEDKVFSILPFNDWDFSSGKASMQTIGALVGGPAGSQLAKFADGAALMRDGQMYKGVEKFMPKGVESAMQSFRMANEGYTMRNGDVLVKPEDISGFALAMNSIGMPTSELKEIQWKRGLQYETQTFFNDRTKQIEHDYARAYKEHDAEAMAELRQHWTELQKSKDEWRSVFNGSHDFLKKQPLSNLLKYPQTVAKREGKEQRSISKD